MTIVSMFRAAGRRALIEAAELEWLASTDDTLVAAAMRFRAAVLRLGAAIVGAS